MRIPLSAVEDQGLIVLYEKRTEKVVCEVLVRATGYTPLSFEIVAAYRVPDSEYEAKGMQAESRYREVNVEQAFLLRLL